MSLSTFEFNELQRRQESKKGKFAVKLGVATDSNAIAKGGEERDKSRDEEYEKDLHEFIIEECKKRRWLCFYNYWGVASPRTPGEMDFEIYADNGRIILIECKAKGKKLTPDQRDIHHWLGLLGHLVHVAYSKEQILAIFDSDLK